MARFKRKISWKRVISLVLGIVIVLGAVGGVMALVKKDTETISSLAFKRGDLDENGKYVESDKAIYTEEAFRFEGLRIEPNFEFKGTFDVYYYDYDGGFLESKNNLNSVYDEDYPPVAYYARVVIHPEISENVTEKDFKIKFWEVSKYAKKISITVNKNQESKYDMNNLYIDDNAQNGKSFNYGEDNETLTVFESSVQKLSERIPVYYENYDIYMRWTNEFNDYSAAVVVTSNDKVIERVNRNMLGEKAGEWVKLELSLDSVEADYDLIVKLPIDAECYIFGYND